MTQRQVAYDHPATVVRMTHAFGQNTAGASTNFSKFVAFTAMQVYAIQAAAITAGTSTQTQWNGTGTVVNINGDQFHLIHVFNVGGVIGTSTTTAVSTTTHGPFSLSTGTGTVTSAAGATTRVQLYGTAVTGNVQAGSNSADGGVAVAQGDTLHILRGTDATAVSAFALELGVQPNANFSS